MSYHQVKSGYVPAGNIVANREYTITVSAISDQGISYPSDPVVVIKFFYIAIYMCTYSFITTNMSYIYNV